MTNYNIFNLEVYKYVLADTNREDTARVFARVYSSVKEYIQDMIYESWGEDN